MKVATAFVAIIGSVMSIAYALFRVRAADWAWLTGEGHSQQNTELLRDLGAYLAAAIGLVAAVLALRLWENKRAVVTCGILLAAAAVLIAVTGQGASALRIVLFGVGGLLSFVKAGFARGVPDAWPVSSTQARADSKSNDGGEQDAERKNGLATARRRKNGIACPNCGSKEYRKRFFAGSDTTGVVCMVLALVFMASAGVFEVLLDALEGSVGGWAGIMERIAAHKVSVDQLVLVVLFILLSIMGFASKKYRCATCRTTFS